MLELRTLVRSAFLASTLAAFGCGSNPPPEAATPAKKEAVAPTSDEDKPTPPSKDSVPNTPTASGVKISDEIVKACGITAPEAYFAFDSAHVRENDAKVFDKLASCFATGPLKGRKMKLVGHADPRGDTDYNTQLGLSRADSVAKYLNTKGLSKDQTSTTSRGAMDATGTDDASWALDRRVDIMLGD